MTDLAQLIERLEAASEGSRELDALVWVAATGSTFSHLAENAHLDRVTTSLDAIVALIERILPGVAGWSVALDTYDNSAALTDMAGETRGAVAKTLPLAACIAFLRALQAQQETSEDE